MNISRMTNYQGSVRNGFMEHFTKVLSPVELSGEILSRRQELERTNSSNHVDMII
jgi:hypothetical protein